MRKTLLALPLLALASVANANPLPAYPTPGVVNLADYSFTATADGTITAYFAGASAGFTSVLGLIVNGVDVGVTGLNNQTTAIGTSFDFGGVTVNAGDSLVFYIDVINTGNRFFSSRILNPDGITHIFSAPYAGGLVGPGGTIPAGVYIGFEDLLGGGDLDYNDLMFVFTNVGGGVIPEPATWAMLIAGFGLVGLAARRRRVTVAA
ncbi:MAG: PEPxxWA-CTERM sorting domain-containing protein [Sphingomonadaceae bacterium]